MNKHVLVWLSILLLCVLIHPFPSAQAISTGSGELSLSAGITYDPDALTWFHGPSDLETWTIGQIHDYTANIMVSTMEPIYGEASVPGWDKEPEPISIAYGGSSVDINNDHDAPMTPIGNSSIAMSTAGASDASLQVYANIMYFANLRAIADGSFTFFVDHEGSWTGSTTSLDDYVFLSGDLQVSVTKLDYNESGQWIGWGDSVGYSQKNEYLTIRDGDVGGIADFSGRLSVTVDFLAGESFYLRFDGLNQVYGYSKGQPPVKPVPEPATWLLLGAGLVGFAGFRKKLKRL